MTEDGDEDVVPVSRNLKRHSRVGQLKLLEKRLPANPVVFHAGSHPELKADKILRSGGFFINSIRSPLAREKVAGIGERGVRRLQSHGERG